MPKMRELCKSDKNILKRFPEWGSRTLRDMQRIRRGVHCGSGFGNNCAIVDGHIRGTGMTVVVVLAVMVVMIVVKVMMMVMLMIIMMMVFIVGT